MASPGLELGAPEWNQQVVEQSFSRSCRKELKPGGSRQQKGNMIDVYNIAGVPTQWEN